MSRRFTRTAAAFLLAGSMAFTGCGNTIDTAKTLITMDGQTKTVGLANFMCQYEAVMYDSYYVSYFGEDMWDSDIYSTGSTMAEEVKSDVLDEVQELYLLEAHMSDYGVALSAEEEESIRNSAAAFLADNSKKALKYMGADQAIVEEYLRLLTIRNKMTAAIKAGADTEVSDDEAIQKKISYIFIKSDYDPKAGEEDGESSDESADKVVDIDVDYADEDAGGSTPAEEYAFLIALLSETKSLEDITADYTDFTVSTGYYSKSDLDVESNDSGLDAEVLQAAESLAIGQVTSELVTTDEGYYIIRLDSDNDEEATASKRESIITERASDLYDDTLQGYIDACNWSVDESVWEKVNFKNFYKIISNKVEETTEDAGTEAE